MEELDPLRLSRRLARAAQAWRDWRRALRRGEGWDHDPFALQRADLGRTAYQRLLELPSYDPLRDALLTWTYRLTEARIDGAAMRAVLFERHDARHVLHLPEYGRYSVGDLIRRVVSDGARRDAWFDGAQRSSAAAHSAVTALWDRRAEVATRIGVDLDRLQLPSADIADLARATLQATDAAFQSLGDVGFTRVVGRALAHRADARWPTRSDARSLSELVGGGDLLRGLDLDVGDVPPARSPASFLRALARLGAAWSVAQAPTTVPFVVAHDPQGLQRYRDGALFVLLASSAPFAQRRLGLGRQRAREVHRELAVSVLVALRLAAARVLLRLPALSGARELREAFEEQSARVFGQPLPGDLAGVVLRLRSDDPARLAGALLAGQRAHELLVDHDEDWFDNPRAHARLRDEGSRAPVTRASRSDLELGLAATQRVLEAALS